MHCLKIGTLTLFIALGSAYYINVVNFYWEVLLKCQGSKKPLLKVPWSSREWPLAPDALPDGFLNENPVWFERTNEVGEDSAENMKALVDGIRNHSLFANNFDDPEDNERFCYNPAMARFMPRILLLSQLLYQVNHKS